MHCSSVLLLRKNSEAKILVRRYFVEELNKTYRQAQFSLEEIENSAIKSLSCHTLTFLHLELKYKFIRPIKVIEGAQKTTSIIHVHQFSGSRMDWPNFFDMFTLVIDNDNELSNI